VALTPRRANTIFYARLSCSRGSIVRSVDEKFSVVDYADLISRGFSRTMTTKFATHEARINWARDKKKHTLMQKKSKPAKTSFMYGAYGFCRSEGSDDGTRRVTTGATTNVEPCKMTWGRYRRILSPTEPACGCVLCKVKQQCNREDCVPPTLPENVTELCTVSCAATPPDCNGAQFRNASLQTIYLLVYRGNTFGSYVLQPQGILPVGNPEEIAFYAAAVGNLHEQKAIISLASPTPPIGNVSLSRRNEKNCLSFDFVGTPQKCPVMPLEDKEERRLLDPVQKEWDAFLDDRDLTETCAFLDQSQVYFVSTRDDTYWDNAQVDGTFSFTEKTGSPIPLVFTQQAPGVFSLRRPNQAYVQIGKPPSISTTFRFFMSKQGPVVPGILRLQRKVSFFPVVSTSENTMTPVIGFGAMPWGTQNPGLDSATLVLVSLPSTGINDKRNQFLEDAPQSAVQCCVGGSYDSFQRAICEGSSFTPQKPGAATSKCDNVMDHYCTVEEGASLPEDRKVSCGCYESVAIKNPIQKLLMDTLKERGIDLPRTCLVAECRTGLAYKNRAVRDAESCPGLCFQIQQIIDRGELGHINFKGVQELTCGDQKLQPPPELRANNKISLGLFIAAGVIFILGIVIVAPLKAAGAYYSIPVLLAVVLAIVGLLFYFYVL
jgi:hypothetical protein